MFKYIIENLSVFVSAFLLVAVSFLGFNYYQSVQEVKQMEQKLTAYQFNEKVLSFTRFFASEVLGSGGEVSFETRLSMENVVRNLNDEDILIKWKAFTASETTNEAQNNVKDLLNILLGKIKL